MEFSINIGNNFIQETVRSPFLLVVRDGDSFSETVKLKSSGSNSVHDRSIVDGLNLDSYIN